MIFSLDVLPARKGDCLLLYFGTKDDPHLAIIDGGPSKVYKPHLKPRLQQIREAKGLHDQESLVIDVLMISHVDDDHIQGILDLTKELGDAKKNQQPLMLDVLSLWHNSFDDLLDTEPGELRDDTVGYGAAAASGEIDLEDCEEEDVAKVLASINQGRELRDAAEFLDWCTNREFNGKLISAMADAAPVELPGGLKMTTVGPMKSELIALQEMHDTWVKDNQDKIADSSAGVPAAYRDSSVANLSSLVFLAELEGKTMLFTGDARGDKVLEGLEMAGLLKPGADNNIHVDILKGPHHGSSNNLDADFFQRVTADHYVFSGDGEHGNPERETFEMLFAARPDAKFTIHLTYPIEKIDVERKKDWEKAQNKEKQRRAQKRTEAEKAKVRVRGDWSPAEHSLAGFFTLNPLKAQQEIAIVDRNRGHIIDLGDSVVEAFPGLTRE